LRDQGFEFRVQGVGWFRTFYRAFGGAALRVHVFDARVDAAISHVTVIPAPRTEALAGSVAKTPAMLVALVRKRALGRAALRVHVLDARVDTTVMNEAVIPAPPAPALAGSVAQATPVLVAGTWGLRVRVQVGGFRVQGLGSGVKGFGSRV
jgi:hypothetical protein